MSRTQKRSKRETGREAILADYRVGFRSRQASLLGRKEVFSGKAKFGIFGDGKEVAQLAMARAFRPGDVRAGYYRDQTFMLALGVLTVEQFFAQLYAHADVEADPSSAGRQMTAHFATRLLEPDGSWKALVEEYNSSADGSPTASQMPRLVGLAYASRLYRELPELHALTRFSRNGDEVAFGTIGNASCAEGLFWEAVNAIGVLRAPAVISIWDDGYGISVPNEHQITNGSVSELLQGFRRGEGTSGGFDVHRVRGWDYAALRETYLEAADTARREHVPSIVHVVEMTQPQGHSTSGSHERYKSKERLAWEREVDCLARMRDWMIEQGIVEADALDRLEDDDRAAVVAAKDRAWKAYLDPIREERDAVSGMLEALAGGVEDGAAVRRAGERLRSAAVPLRRDLVQAATDALVATRGKDLPERARLAAWRRRATIEGDERYGSHLYSESARSPLRVEAVPPAYDDDAEMLRGFEILNRCFDAALARHPELIAFGEDVGKLGDVNQGFMGLQEHYGELRVSDAGIREATLLGQAIGMAERGLRPLVEIQYLDYMLYALQTLSDDLASLRWRTRGGQKAPVIVRTRGHRLEGVWHSGSPMAGILNLVRGVHVCVPRDMTRAAGMYNTLLRGDDPAIVVEVLNGYRLREPLPANIGEFTVELGVPEVLREGRDVTLVTYGACCRIALEAAEPLRELGVDIEIVDVGTLLPFDRRGVIARSLRKTARLVLVDEDVPGGTTAYMMRQILEVEDGYHLLDSKPVTVPAKEHRPAYGSDGDYWSKPSRESIVEAVYGLLRESEPGRFPETF